MYEILQRTPNISLSRWALAGRNIGQDIMGTMTNILIPIPPVKARAISKDQFIEIVYVNVLAFFK
jgi:hypothetical protein